LSIDSPQNLKSRLNGDGEVQLERGPKRNLPMIAFLPASTGQWTHRMQVSTAALCVRQLPAKQVAQPNGPTLAYSGAQMRLPANAGFLTVKS
jgi:hypothetical protein